MNVYLLQRDEPFWKVVEVYLEGINARAITLRSEQKFKGPMNHRPDLVIAGRKSLDHPLARTIRSSLIVIDETGERPLDPVGPGGRSPSVLRWPFTKREFLQATAEVLDLDPRKEFRALVRIGLSRNDFGTLAESRDFSVSGMSFTSTARFSPVFPSWIRSRKGSPLLRNFFAMLTTRRRFFLESAFLESS